MRPCTPWLLLGLQCLSLMACVRRYEAARPDQPHAVLKFRRTYQQTPGESLTETIIIDKRVALRLAGPSSLGVTTRTDAVLVHPVAAKYHISAIFTHTYTTSQTQSYSCGSAKYPTTCTRTATVTHTAVDGACVAQFRIYPEPLRNYLIQLDYQDRKYCTVKCYIETPKSDSELINSHCRFLEAE